MERERRALGEEPSVRGAGEAGERKKRKKAV